MQEISKQFIEAIKMLTSDHSIFSSDDIARLYVEEGNVLSLREIDGLKIKTEEISDGVKLRVEIEEGMKIEKPVFLCFEILGTKGRQIVFPEIILRQNSQADILANCIFPNAREVVHKMEAKILLEENAKLNYLESHYHGESFGADVVSNLDVVLKKGSLFENNFSLTKGSIGRLRINLNLKMEERAFSHIFTKVIGKGGQDNTKIVDRVFLEGKDSSSMLKMKGAAVNGGKLFFEGKIEAAERATGAIGHLDCQEIIVGKDSFAQSIPVIAVNNPEARITHEASVGKVSQKELGTLMTRGLSEEEAIDFIVRGKLK